MPDTGAPWNIPYVEAADLVSDWPADSLALANAIADGLDEAGNAGIGSNVAYAAASDFTTSSTSEVDITGATVTITPTSATSKILVMFNFSELQTNNNFCYTRVYRDAASIAGTGQAQGGREMGSLIVLDSPATTSSLTYKATAQMFSGSATWRTPRIIAIEVAA